MKADITRSTYNKNKQYTKVNVQQGRVQLDADWNEQLDIQEHFNRTLLCDLVGNTGTSLENPGFDIVADNKSGGFTIGKGRYYVNGIICENDSDKPLYAENQEDLPYCSLFEENYIVPKDSKTDSYFVIYLDVWQRHITFLEDPDLLEVALGRVDTTTRTKNVWQVKTMPVSGGGDVQAALSDFEKNVFRSTGKLRVRAKPVSTQDRCESINAFGYSGDENRLYRVEIHSRGTIASKKGYIAPVFKWSRENAFVAAKIQNVTRDQADENKFSIFIESNGKDDLYTFRAGQWIEVTDDYYELWNIPGQLLKIDTVEVNHQENQSTLKVTVPSKTDNPHKLLGYIADEGKYISKNAKVRRWNTTEDKWSILSDYYANKLSYTPADTAITYDDNTAPEADTGTVKSTSDEKDVRPDNIIEYVANADAYLDLEDGIQLKFETGNYEAGDYWLIPARAITKSIEWPIDASQSDAAKKPIAIPSMMEHHYCPLALLKCSATTKDGVKPELTVVCDYREFFSNATTNAALNFYYEKGDGQKITPRNVHFTERLPAEAPLELCVRAEIGNIPIDTLKDRLFVRFKIVKDAYDMGRLVNMSSKTKTASFMDVAFVNGVASCGWVFSPTDLWLKDSSGMVTPGEQCVSASLMRRTGLGSVVSCPVAQVLFFANFAQPELRYKSGDGQFVLTDVTSVPLVLCVEVAGLPLSSLDALNSYLRIWKVNVRFMQTVGGGVLNQSGVTAILEPDDEGLVNCIWKPDGSHLYQQVKAELVSSNNKDRSIVGSTLFFHATLPSSVNAQQGAIVATSGVIKLLSSAFKGDAPQLSGKIVHGLSGCAVPPAIILSLIPSNAVTPKLLEGSVESFEDFGLYNWASKSLYSKRVFPRFKVFEVDLTGFKILVESPYPPDGQDWYLRWWAIPAQNKDTQTPSFAPFSDL